MAKSTRKSKASPETASEAAPTPAAAEPAPAPAETSLPAFVPETLAADVREQLLDIFRHRSQPWTKLNELDQNNILARLDHLVRATIRQTVEFTVAAEFPAIGVAIVRPIKTTKEDVIEAKITMPYSDDDVIALHRQGRAILVLANPDLFFNPARQETVAQRDQPDLDLGAKDDALTEEQVLKNLEEANAKAAARKAGASAEDFSDATSLVWTEKPGGVWSFAGIDVKNVKGGAGFEWRAVFQDGTDYRHIGLAEVKQFVEAKVGAQLEADLPPEREREAEPVA